MNTSLALKVALLLGMVATVAVFLIVWRLLNITISPQASVASTASVISTSTAGSTGAVSPTPQASTTPAAVTAVANAYPNVHTGIGTTSPIVGTLTRGETIQVIGRSADAVWLKIEYSKVPSGVGWVYADLITLSTPKSALPVATPP